MGFLNVAAQIWVLSQKVDHFAATSKHTGPELPDLSSQLSTVLYFQLKHSKYLRFLPGSEMFDRLSTIG